MRNRGAFTDGHRSTRFGVNDYAVLDVRMGADDDGLHVPFVIDLVGADHRVRPDEDVLVHHHPAAQEGGRVHERALMHLGQIASWVLSNHAKRFCLA